MTSAQRDVTVPPPVGLPPGPINTPIWRKWVNVPHIVTALFLMAGGILISHHGVWRDEAQAFLIARDSHSIREMLAVTQYEGHPPLWHFLLYFLTRFTDAPEAMQIFHLLLAATSVYLVARFSPFPLIARILFPFGYFTLFEYGVIARNYQLFMLLSIILCIVWLRRVGTRQRPYLWIALLLVLLCLTHVLGFILAAAFFGTLLAESVFTHDGRRAVCANPIRFAATILIVAGGMLLTVKLLKQPSDGNFSPGWQFDLEPYHIWNTLTSLWRAYVPMSEWRVTFWGTHYITAKNTEPPLAILAFIAVFVLLRVSWRAKLFFLCSTLGLLVFAHVKYFGGPRHYGALFVALICSFWIAWSGYRPHTMIIWKRILWLTPRIAFVALLAVQAYASFVAAHFTIFYPFSRARDAAPVLRSLVQPGDIIFGDITERNAPLAAYMPGQQFYYPRNGGRMGTYTIWRHMPGTQDGFYGAQNLADKRQQAVIFVADAPLRKNRWNRYRRATLVASFPSGIVNDEGYFFYRIEPRPPRRSGD